VTSNHSIRRSVAAYVGLTRAAEFLHLKLPNGACTPTNALCRIASSVWGTITGALEVMWKEMIVIYFNILKRNGKDMYKDML
jgi:hypothetical protein